MKVGIGSSAAPARVSPRSKASYTPATSETLRFIHCTGVVPGVVDGVRVAGAADDAGRALDRGRAPVDGELRFAVENDEHLFDDVVEVVADAGARRDHAAMQEVEFRRHGAPVEQRRERHAAGAGVDGARLPERRGVGVDDARRRALAARPAARARANTTAAATAAASERALVRSVMACLRLTECPRTLVWIGPRGRFPHHVQHVAPGAAEGHADGILRHPDRAGIGAVRQEDLDPALGGDIIPALGVHRRPVGAGIDSGRRGRPRSSTSGVRFSIANRRLFDSDPSPATS